MSCYVGLSRFTICFTCPWHQIHCNSHPFGLTHTHMYIYTLTYIYNTIKHYQTISCTWSPLLLVFVWKTTAGVSSRNGLGVHAILLNPKSLRHLRPVNHGEVNEKENWQQRNGTFTNTDITFSTCRFKMIQAPFNVF